MAAYEFEIDDKIARLVSKRDHISMRGNVIDSTALKMFLFDQSGTTLVRLFNSTRPTSVEEVRKFSDKGTAARRLFKQLEALPFTKEKVKSSKKIEMITLNSEIDPELKLPKQAIGIVACLQELNADNEPVSRVTLIEKMKSHVVSNQPLDCIFSFYKNKLVNSGCIVVTKETI